jgi:gliding motility-associated lipoprotein GldD
MPEKRNLWIGILAVYVGVSCTHYTPKPRGYFRIELPDPVYVPFGTDSLPCTFHVSAMATVENPPEGAPPGGINVFYPSLDARIYCSCLPVTPSSLEVAMRESQALVSRQARDVRHVTEQAYEDPEERVYALLYELDGASASPVQFVLTDSVAHFFRGALLYGGILNADSLEPVTRYLKADIVELIQSFSWKE